MIREYSFFVCVLLLVTCYLLPVICYLLSVTCYCYFSLESTYFLELSTSD